MSPEFVLGMLASVGGFVILAGGIWLLSKEKIYLDQENKRVSKVELPGRVVFETHTPALVLFAFGMVLMLYPVHGLLERPDEIEVVGSVEGTAFPVDIHNSASSYRLNQPGPFTLVVPRAKHQKNCTVHYIGTGIQGDQVADFEEVEAGHLRLRPIRLDVGSTAQFLPAEGPAQVASHPSAGDEVKP